jgi:DNA-binding LacI/PurR family transcriptional regulator
MTGPDRPTALVTSFESIGEIAYLLALHRGLRIPEDLSIVTVGAADRKGAIVRRLACVTVDEQKAGLITAGMLDRMRRGLLDIDDQEVVPIDIGFDAAESLGCLK